MSCESDDVHTPGVTCDGEDDDVVLLLCVC